MCTVVCAVVLIRRWEGGKRERVHLLLLLLLFCYCAIYGCRFNRFSRLISRAETIDTAVTEPVELFTRQHGVRPGRTTHSRRIVLTDVDNRPFHPVPADIAIAVRVTY